MADDRDEAVVFTSSSKNSDDDDNNNNNNNNNEDGDEDGTTTEPRFANTESLGPGPNRFAAEGERPISEQIASLSADERQCFDNLRIRWKALHPDRPYSDEMYLRFARCSPGKTKFNEKTAWRVMNRFDRRYLVLTASRLESQLLSKTLFPVPGLTTKEGHDVFYMRASRYFPRQTSTKAIIDNLAYCMTTMVEKEKNCAEGIAFLSYMTDWKMQNFAPDYFIQFLRTLQGRVPVRVRLFLIVNPPKFFDRVWMIIKPLLAKEFQNKVRMIPEEALGDYLMDNYTEYLPDDMATGTQPSDVMVHDFVTYRKHVENKHQLVGLKHQQKQMKQQPPQQPPPQDGQK
ncbi:hypothetical protein ACA910_016763 [Epithemia clementina (nom. ined.)]